MTLNTTFKQVFGETLEKHGFVKVKGRQVINALIEAYKYCENYKMT
jgi:hypothetical protein